MKIYVQSAAILLSCALTLPISTTAFAPGSRAFNTARMAQKKITALNMREMSEDSAMELMFRAKECASSESCSIELANEYLREVVQVQSGCAAGTLNGAALCDDVLFSSEVIANLRQKIQAGSEASKSLWNSQGNRLEKLTQAATSSDGVTLSPGQALTKAPFQPLYIGFAALYLAVLLSSVNNVASTTLPFTAQEWWWAARDGYLNDMLVHALKNGGLSMVPYASDVEELATTIPFTPQEWWWAARDGYLNDMVTQSFKNGGFVTLSSANNDDLISLPFSAQEWWWAARDGYLNNMVVHAFKNGGL